MWRPVVLATAITAALASAPRRAEAFCGFYVSGAGGEMFNNATQVVLMRAGTRTVLSMQNAYQGPPQDFALVIPVPVVLQQENVKTLPKEVFSKVDVMGAPRLVEYWEQDPCAPQVAYETMGMAAPALAMESGADQVSAHDGVTVEAKFTVGEYQIVILSATEATGLERWLRAARYQIPAGAAPLLRPYVEGGSKFFVAKVDPKKVQFEGGRAVLSPLRFHYDSDEFALPIRLGLANSAGVQDLIVNILAPGQRYELANYGNATVPTNLDVKDAVRTRFGEFYAALFDRTVEQHPGAVITEYAWDASTCDPCPGPTLDSDDFATLGADVLGADSYGFVLTRLHARYRKDQAPDDLVFRAAPPIVGGREQTDANGKLENGATASEVNNFQGRYAIRHPWTGAITCAAPQRGIWGGPPPEVERAMATSPIAATNLAMAPRGKVALPDLVVHDVPELGVRAGVPLPGAGRGARGCACSTGGLGRSEVVLALAVLAVLLRRRRRAERAS
jgi:MYXO-CTERM domain-containing protein